jgi:hypothetical protein
MKYLLLIIVAVFLLACEKNKEYAWDCKGCVMHIYDDCSYDSIPVQLDLPPMTYDQMKIFEIGHNFNMIHYNGKVKVNTISTLHCMKYTCFE